MSIPRYPPWFAGTMGLATGEKGDVSDPDIRENFTQKTITVAAENSPVPICYGTVSLGGMIFAAGLQIDKLVIGYAFCLGEATLVSMEINGADHAVGVTKNGVRFVAWYKGTLTQSHNVLLAAATGCADDLTGVFDGEPYGVAYAVLEIDISTSIPQPIARVTRGSDNPAAALKEFIESRITGYGKTVDAAAAIAHCDSLVGGRPRYRANMVFDSQESVSSRIEEIRAYASCDVNMSGDTVVLVPRTTGNAVRTLTTKDMVEGSVSFTQPATSDIPNYIEIDWTFDNRAVLSFAEWDDESGERRTQSISMPFITDASQALREAENRLNYYRYNTLTCRFDTFDEGLTTMVGDIVSIDYPMLGGTPQLMRVVNIVSQDPGRWSIELETHNDLMYSNSVDTDPVIPTYNFPPPSTDQAEPVTNLTVTEQLPEAWPCIFDIELLAEWDTVNASGETVYDVTVAEVTAADSIFQGDATIQNQNTLNATNAFATATIDDWVRIEGFPSAENNGLWAIDSITSSDEIQLADAIRTDETVIQNVYNGAADITAPNIINAVGAFTTAQVGQRVELAGFTNFANAGIFTITTKNSNDEVVVVPGSLFTESAALATITVLGATITVMAVADPPVYSETTRNRQATITGLQPVTPYEVRVITITDGQRRSSGVSQRITTSNDHQIPDNVTGFNHYFGCGLAIMYWNFSQVCVSGYELRAGAVGVDWASASLIARINGPSYVHRPQATGDRDYLIKAYVGRYNRADHYSVTEARQTITVPACASSSDHEIRITAIENCLIDEGLCQTVETCQPFEPGFEKGTIGSSSAWFDSIYGDVVTSNPTPQAGGFCLGKDIPQNRGFNIKQVMLYSTDAPTPVTLTAWLYDSDVSTHNILFTMVYFDANGERISSQTFLQASTVGAWGQISQAYTIPSGTRSISLEIGQSPSTENTVFIDTVEITPCISKPASCCPILLNPGFEESTFPVRWRYSGASISTTIARTGNNSLVLNSVGEFAYQQIPICPFAADTTVTFSVWIYKDNASQPDYGLRLYWYDENLIQIGTQACVDRTLSQNATWVQSSCDAVVPPTAHYMRFRMECQSGGIDLHFDDCTVTCT